MQSSRKNATTNVFIRPLSYQKDKSTLLNGFCALAYSCSLTCQPCSAAKADSQSNRTSNPSAHFIKEWSDIASCPRENCELSRLSGWRMLKRLLAGLLQHPATASLIVVCQVLYDCLSFCWCIKWRKQLVLYARKGLPSAIRNDLEVRTG